MSGATDPAAERNELLPRFLIGRVVAGFDVSACDLAFVTAAGSTCDLDELSASERQGVLFAATFRRSGVRGSLVLIDTPELQLHPDDHARFFAALQRLEPGNQILAATTSPAILGMVA